MAAARRCFGGGGPDQTDAALAAFGLRREGPAKQEDDGSEVLACNRKSVRLFRAMRTQWRMGPLGAASLDFSALPVVAGAHGIRVTRRRLADLELMAMAVRAAKLV